MSAIRQYIGARYVPKFFDDGNGSAEWKANVAYEALTIVTYLGNSYTSKKPVPANIGNPSANPAYWASTGIYNQQVEEYRQEVQAALDTINNEINDAIETIQDDIDDALARAESNIDKAESYAYKNALGPIIIAHRGFAGEAPENTIAAFDLCGSVNVDAIETDLQFTSDGIPVCSHDANITAYTGVSSNISSLTYAQLSAIPIINGSNIDYFGNQKIPTFEEFCARAYLNRIIPYIEIKNDYVFDTTKANTVLSILRKYGLKEKAMFISNNLEALDLLLSIDSSLSVMPVLYVEPNESQLTLWASKGYYGIDCTLTGITANAVAKAHDKGLKVYGWTVSTYAQWWGLQTYMNYGLDGFTCDYVPFGVLPNWDTGVRVMGKPNYDGFIGTTGVDSALLGLRCYARGWLGGTTVRDKYAFGPARYYFNNTNRLCFKMPDHTKTVTFHAAGNGSQFRYSVFAIDDDGQVSDSGWITVTNNMTYTIPITRKTVFVQVAATDNETGIGYIKGKREFERLNVSTSLT